MATTDDVKRSKSGRLSYRGESFPGYNKQVRTPGASKKFKVLAKKGDQVKLVRYGDPKMKIKSETCIYFCTILRFYASTVHAHTNIDR